ncbi:MAG: glycosyltransferase family 39 protein [Polyangiaceae bacterium]
MRVEWRSPQRLLALLTAVLVLPKLVGAFSLGFGDSEALYATYAIDLAPGYLDHPGAVGLLARVIALATSSPIPSPLVAHVVTTLLSAAVPWVGVAAARASGASPTRSYVTGLGLIAAPEIAIGLFGLTPDLPLSFCWLATLAFASKALTTHDRARVGFAVLAGAFAAGAVWSKASGGLLVLALFAAVLRPPSDTRDHKEIHHRRGVMLLAVVVALVLIAPLVAFEMGNGWPMLTHRLVSTQSRSGVSLRNLGAFIGGQLAYVSPPLLIAAVLGGWRLLSRSPRSAQRHWLAIVTAISALALGALCLWSRVAEPHWFAPVWLCVAIDASLVESPSEAGAEPSSAPRWVRASALPVGLAMSLLVQLYTLTDLFPAALGGTRWYQGKYDLANDMKSWVQATALLQSHHAQHVERWVVTPHWTVAAQAQVVLGETALVTTRPANPQHASVLDDFRKREREITTRDNGVLTRASRGDARVMVVWDDRFERPSTSAQCSSHEEAQLVRADRVVRTIFIEDDCHAPDELVAQIAVGAEPFL